MGGGGRFFPSDLSSRHARRKTKRNPPYWIFGSQQQRHRWSNSLSRRPFDYYLSLISKFRLAMALLKDPIWRQLAKLNISRTERGVSSMKQNRLLDFRNYIELVVASIISPDNCTKTLGYLFISKEEKNVRNNFLKTNKKL